MLDLISVILRVIILILKTCFLYPFQAYQASRDRHLTNLHSQHSIGEKLLLTFVALLENSVVNLPWVVMVRDVLYSLTVLHVIEITTSS